MSLSMLKDVADFLTPVLQSSHFSTQGVLTPDEFVSSGEQLVHSCRTWQWEGGKAGTQKAYLPLRSSSSSHATYPACAEPTPTTTCRYHTTCTDTLLQPPHRAPSCPSLICPITCALDVQGSREEGG